MAGVSRADALDHRIRRRIYDYLLLHPGAHLREIVRFVAAPFGTTHHHLDVLVAREVITTELKSTKRRYYAAGLRSRPEMNELYRRHWEFRDLRMRVLFAVRRKGRGTPTPIARDLGISRQLAAYHLRWLVESGQLRRERRALVPSKETPPIPSFSPRPPFAEIRMRNRTPLDRGSMGMAIDSSVRPRGDRARRP